VSVFSRWWQKVWLPPSKKPPFLPPSRPHKRWPKCVEEQTKVETIDHRDYRFIY
jgi:hypothetical protein